MLGRINIALIVALVTVYTATAAGVVYMLVDTMKALRIIE